MTRTRYMAGMVLLLFFALAAGAAAEVPAEGYDENTEVTIQGVVKEIMAARRGPVLLKLSRQDKIYTVSTAPVWYLEQEKMSFASGMEIEVTGSRGISTDGTLYIIARLIKDIKTGISLTLRDDTLRPAWRGRGRR